MSLESANYPNQLVATNPPFDDPKNQGDDHIRLIKNVLTITFANIGGVLGLTVDTSANHTWTGKHNFSAATQMSLPATTVSGTLDATGLMSAAAPVLTSNSNQVATTSFVQALFTATPASLAWRSRMMFFGGNK